MKFSRLERGMLILAVAVVAFALGLWWSSRGAAGTFTVQTETAAGQVEAAEIAAVLPEDTTGKLDLNTATLEELEALPEIGPGRAQAILDYRAENGPFRYAEQLLDVPGIGEGTLEAVLDHVTVKEADA